MLYMIMGDGVKLLVLDPSNIQKLKAGKIVCTPDQTVIFAYTPDLEWTAGKISDMVLESLESGAGFDARGFDNIIKESISRPEILDPKCKTGSMFFPQGQKKSTRGN